MRQDVLYHQGNAKQNCTLLSPMKEDITILRMALSISFSCEIKFWRFEKLHLKLEWAILSPLITLKHQ